MSSKIINQCKAPAVNTALLFQKVEAAAKSDSQAWPFRTVNLFSRPISIADASYRFSAERFSTTGGLQYRFRLQGVNTNVVLPEVDCNSGKLIGTEADALDLRRLSYAIYAVTGESIQVTTPVSKYVDIFGFKIPIPFSAVNTDISTKFDII